MSDSARASSRTPADSASGTNGPSGHTPLLIDAKAAAAVLAISPRTLWQLTNCRAVPSRKIGRSVRYCPGELRAWIAAGCPTRPGAADGVRKGAAR